MKKEHTKISVFYVKSITYNPNEWLRKDRWPEDVEQLNEKTLPDPVYNSSILSKFINNVMLDGKKQKARNIVYQAVEQFAKKVGAEDPLAAFMQALENATPRLEVKSRRIGGPLTKSPLKLLQSAALQWL